MTATSIIDVGRCHICGYVVSDYDDTLPAGYRLGSCPGCRAHLEPVSRVLTADHGLGGTPASSGATPSTSLPAASTPA